MPLTPEQRERLLNRKRELELGVTQPSTGLTPEQRERLLKRKRELELGITQPPAGATPRQQRLANTFSAGISPPTQPTPERTFGSVRGRTRARDTGQITRPVVSPPPLITEPPSPLDYFDKLSQSYDLSSQRMDLHSNVLDLTKLNLTDDEKVVRANELVAQRDKIDQELSTVESDSYIGNIGIMAASIAPSIVETVKRSLYGLGSGAAIGAVTAGPAGALAVGKTGFVTGGLVYTANEGYGAAYLDAIKDGRSHEVAVATATGFAPVYAALSRLQIGNVLNSVLGKGLNKKVASDIMPSVYNKFVNKAEELGKRAGPVGTTAARITADTVVETFSEVAQDYANLSARELASRYEEGEGLSKQEWDRSIGDYLDMAAALSVIVGTPTAAMAGIDRRVKVKKAKKLIEASNSEFLENDLGVDTSQKKGDQVRQVIRMMEDGSLRERIEASGLLGDEQGLGSTPPILTDDQVSSIRNKAIELSVKQGFEPDSPELNKRIESIVVAANLGLDRYQEIDTFLTDALKELAVENSLWDDTRTSFVRAEGEADFQADMLSTDGKPTGARVYVKTKPDGMTEAVITDANNQALTPIVDKSYDEVVRQLQYYGDANVGALIVNKDNIEIVGRDEQAVAQQVANRSKPDVRRIHQWRETEVQGPLQEGGAESEVQRTPETVEDAGPVFGEETSKAAFLNQQLQIIEGTNDVAAQRQIISGIQDLVAKGEISQRLYEAAIRKLPARFDDILFPELEAQRERDFQQRMRDREEREVSEQAEADRIARQQSAVGIPDETRQSNVRQAQEDRPVEGMENIIDPTGGMTLREDADQLREDAARVDGVSLHMLTKGRLKPSEVERVKRNAGKYDTGDFRTKMLVGNLSVPYTKPRGAKNRGVVTASMQRAAKQGVTIEELIEEVLAGENADVMRRQGITDTEPESVNRFIDLITQPETAYTRIPVGDTALDLEFKAEMEAREQSLGVEEDAEEDFLLNMLDMLPTSKEGSIVEPAPTQPEPETQEPQVEPTPDPVVEPVVEPTPEVTEQEDARGRESVRTYDEGDPSPPVSHVGTALPEAEQPIVSVRETEAATGRRASGQTSLIGKRVSDAKSLGLAFEPLRNIQSEWTYIVLRNADTGEILSVDGHSFNLPAASPSARDFALARRGDARFREQLRDRVSRLRSRTGGANVIADVVHNHPSGNAMPSKKDLELTYEFAELFDPIDGVSFGEHTIVNTGEASSIQRDGTWSLYDIYDNQPLTDSGLTIADVDMLRDDPELSGRRAAARRRDPLLGLYSRTDVIDALFGGGAGDAASMDMLRGVSNAQIGQYLKHDQGKLALGVILDSKNNVRNAVPFDVNLLSNPEEFGRWSRNRRIENAGRRMVVYYGAHDEESQIGVDQFKELVAPSIESGDVFDAVYTSARERGIRGEVAAEAAARPEPFTTEVPPYADDVPRISTADGTLLEPEAAPIEGAISELLEGDSGRIKRDLNFETLSEDAVKIAEEISDELQLINPDPAPTPEKFITGYRLMQAKPKSEAADDLFSLYVLNTTPVVQGEWVLAKSGPRMKSGRVKATINKGKGLAWRGGWHSGSLPASTHIGGMGVQSAYYELYGITADNKKASPVYRRAKEKWVEVSIPDDVDWQSVADSRAVISEDTGRPDPKTAHITDQVPYGGHYKYKTNPNMTGSWLISGSMKINRRLDRDEVVRLGEEGGLVDLPLLPDWIRENNVRFEHLTGEAQKELAQVYPDDLESIYGRANAEEIFRQLEQAKVDDPSTKKKTVTKLPQPRKPDKRPLRYPDTLQEEADPLPVFKKNTTGSKKKGEFVPVNRSKAKGGNIKAFEVGDRIRLEHPNPLTSESEFDAWLGKVVGIEKTTDQVIAPVQAIEWANDSDSIAEYVGGLLTDDMRNLANEGLDYSRERAEMYANGEMTVYDTIHHYMWNILSTGTSPYEQEAAYLETLVPENLERLYDIFEKCIETKGEYIRPAKKGVKNRDINKFINQGLAIQHSGRPSASSKNMFNSFFRYLGAITGPAEGADADGRSVIQYLHDMLSDPNLSGREIRRNFFNSLPLDKSVGMENKLISFMLLTSGKFDVLVLDRVQTRNLWGAQYPKNLVYGDGKEEIDVYDLVDSKLFHGPRGAVFYEALEDALAPSIKEGYSKIGRAEDGNVGTFHWESYSIAGDMAVPHRTLGASIDRARGKDPKEIFAGSSTRQGKLDKSETGISYTPLTTGEARFFYTLRNGERVVLDQRRRNLFVKRDLEKLINKAKRDKGIEFDGVSEKRYDESGKQVSWLQYLGEAYEEQFEEAVRKRAVEVLPAIEDVPSDPARSGRYTRLEEEAAPFGEEQGQDLLESATQELAAQEKPVASGQQIDFDTINYGPSFPLASEMASLDRQSLDRVTDRLSSFYPDYTAVTDQESFDQRATELGRKPEKIAGFVDRETSTVFINPSLAKSDTPLHQFSHIWLDRLQTDSPELYDQATELVRRSPYYERASKAGFGVFAEEEALAQLIGEKGAGFIDGGQATRKDKGIIKRLMAQIAKIAKRFFRTSKAIDVNEMTLEDFVEGAVDAVTQNRPMKTGAGVPSRNTEYRQKRAELDRISFGGNMFYEPIDDVARIADEYMESKGLGRLRDRRILKVPAAQGKAIADVYHAMEHDPRNPVVLQAYQDMANETMEQFEAILREGYEVELFSEGVEPYKSSRDMIDDVRENKHMFVFATDQESSYGKDGITPELRAESPLLADSGYKDINGKTLLINDVFRFVHDFFGHAKRGNGFGQDGEENAWEAHSQMYTDNARRAMTSETRGQNSWVNFGPQLRLSNGKLPTKTHPEYKPIPERDFADQKNNLMPDEIVFPERFKPDVLLEEATPLAEDADPLGGDIPDPIKRRLDEIFAGLEKPAQTPLQDSSQEAAEEAAEVQGNITPDQPLEAATEAPAPPQGTEERAFARNLDEQGRTPPEGEGRFYRPQTNLETRRQAESIYIKDGIGGVRAALGDSEGDPPSALRTALGIVAYTHYENEAKAFQEQGDTRRANGAREEAIAIANLVSKRLTSAGQATQAASMISMLDPDTIGLWAQRQIDRINERYKLKGKKERQLPEEEKERLKELAGKGQELVDLNKSQQEVNEAMTRAIENEPLTTEDIAIITEYRDKATALLVGEPVPEGTRVKRTPKDTIRRILTAKIKNRAANARQRLRDMNVLRGGLPADVMADLVVVGLDQMVDGATDFKRFREAMQAELQQEIGEKDFRKLFVQTQREFGSQKKQARVDFRQLKTIDDFLSSVQNDPEMQQYEQVTALVDAISKMSNLTEQAQVSVGQQIQQVIDRMEPRRLTGYLTAVLNTARLLAPKTALRNIIGNQLLWNAEQLATVVAAGIDRAGSAVTGSDREIVLTGQASDVLPVVKYLKGIPVYGFKGSMQKVAPELIEGARSGYTGESPAGLPTQADLPMGLTFDTMSEDFRRLQNIETPVIGTALRGTYRVGRVLEGLMSAQLRGFDLAAYMRAYNTVMREQATIALTNQGRQFESEQEREAWISNWISTADDSVQGVADQYGRYVTFQDDTDLAGFAVGLKRLLNADSRLVVAGKSLGKDPESESRSRRSIMLGEFVIAYPRVPANIINRGLAYSPFGVLRSAYQYYDAAKLAEGGPKDLREAKMAFSRALIGTGVTALTYKLAELGIMTGDEEEEIRARDLQRDVTGETKYQINITALTRYLDGYFDTGLFSDALAIARKGDKLMTYDWAQPLAISAALGVNASQSIGREGRKQKPLTKGGAGYLDVPLEGLKGAMRTVEEQPMLTGLRDLFGAGFTDRGIGENVLRILEGVPSGFVPQIVNQVRQYTDNTRRDAYTGNIVQRIVNRTFNRLPFISKTLNASYKAIGKDMPKEIYTAGTNSFFNVFINPAFVTEYMPEFEEDPDLGDMALTMLEPYEQTGTVKSLPPRVKKTIKVQDENGKYQEFTLTPDDKAKLRNYLANRITAIYKDNAKRIKAGSPEQQLKDLGEVMEIANKQTREYFRKNMMKTYPPYNDDDSGIMEYVRDIF